MTEKPEAGEVIEFERDHKNGRFRYRLLANLRGNVDGERFYASHSSADATVADLAAAGFVPAASLAAAEAKVLELSQRLARVAEMAHDRDDDTVEKRSARLGKCAALTWDAVKAHAEKDGIDRGVLKWTPLAQQLSEAEARVAELSDALDILADREDREKTRLAEQLAYERAGRERAERLHEALVKCVEHTYGYPLLSDPDEKRRSLEAARECMLAYEKLRDASTPAPPSEGPTMLVQRVADGKVVASEGPASPVAEAMAWMASQEKRWERLENKNAEDLGVWQAYHLCRRTLESALRSQSTTTQSKASRIREERDYYREQYLKQDGEYLKMALTPVASDAGGEKRFSVGQRVRIIRGWTGPRSIAEVRVNAIATKSGDTLTVGDGSFEWCVNAENCELLVEPPPSDAGGEKCRKCGRRDCDNKESLRDCRARSEVLGPKSLSEVPVFISEAIRVDLEIFTARLVAALRLPGAHGAAEYALNRVADELAKSVRGGPEQ